MSIKARLLFLCGFLSGLPLLAAPAQAQLISTCLTVNVTVDPLSFSYLPSTAGQQSANIKIACGIGLWVLPSITVGLTAGNSTSFTARRMDDGTGNNHLSYNIYTTSGHGTVWGDGTDGSQTQSVTGGLLGQTSYTFAAYGLIPAGQYVAATAYTDNVTIQITF